MSWTSQQGLTKTLVRNSSRQACLFLLSWYGIYSTYLLCHAVQYKNAGNAYVALVDKMYCEKNCVTSFGSSITAHWDSVLGNWHCTLLCNISLPGWLPSNSYFTILVPPIACCETTEPVNQASLPNTFSKYGHMFWNFFFYKVEKKNTCQPMVWHPERNIPVQELPVFSSPGGFEFPGVHSSHCFQIWLVDP